MPRARLAVGLAMVLIASTWSQSSAQLCTPAFVSLTPCFNYITGNSLAPSATCCSSLAAIAQSQAMMCLCSVFGIGASALGISVNQSQALTLPGTCNVRVPPLGQCTAASATPTTTAAAPAEGTPAPDSQLTPSVPSEVSPSTPQPTPPVPGIPSGSGSKTVPTTGVASSARSSTKLNSCLFLVLITYASVLSHS